MINISPTNVSKKCFCKQNISKIVRPVLAAVNVNGLKALMTVWSKGLPLTASCLSPVTTVRLRIPPGHVRKLLVTSGYAVVFAGHSGFLHLTLSSNIL